jgi:hypothetical protein
MNRLIQLAAIMGFLMATGCKTNTPDQPPTPPNPYGTSHAQGQPGGSASVTYSIAFLHRLG